MHLLNHLPLFLVMIALPLRLQGLSFEHSKTSTGLGKSLANRQDLHSFLHIFRQ